MDEGRKRVLGLMAAILTAKQMNHGSAWGLVILPVFKFRQSVSFQMVAKWYAGCVIR
jgi:hypothetical protein